VRRQPYIVTIAGPIDEFRRSLQAAIPEAGVAQELTGGRVVVVLPAGLSPGRLRDLPSVTAVMIDELRKTLPGGSAGASKT